MEENLQEGEAQVPLTAEDNPSTDVDNKLPVEESVGPVIDWDEATEVVDPQHNISLPIVDGQQVVSILDDGRETETHYHCQMANGTTMHVAKEVFLTE